VIVNSNGATASITIDQAFLSRIANTSAGAIALYANDSATNLDFSAATGANLTAI